MKHTQQEIEKSIPFTRMPMLCLGEPRRNFVYNEAEDGLLCYTLERKITIPFISSSTTWLICLPNVNTFWFSSSLFFAYNAFSMKCHE